MEQELDLAPDGGNDMPDWIVPPVVVPADGMPWNYLVGGKEKTVFPQKGRTITVLPLATDDLTMILNELAVQSAISQDTPEGQEPGPKQKAAALRTFELAQELREAVGLRIIDWDLVGADRLPLPRPPHGLAHEARAQFFAETMRRRLPVESAKWLGDAVARVVNGDPEDEAVRGKGSSPSGSRSRAARTRR